MEYWKYQLESWLDKHDVLAVSFDGLHSAFRETVGRLAEFLRVAPYATLTHVRLAARNSGNRTGEVARV